MVVLLAHEACGPGGSSEQKPAPIGVHPSDSASFGLPAAILERLGTNSPLRIRSTIVLDSPCFRNTAYTLILNEVVYTQIPGQYGSIEVPAGCISRRFKCDSTLRRLVLASEEYFQLGTAAECFKNAR